jgi:uncharacterized membrane protein
MGLLFYFVFTLLFSVRVLFRMGNEMVNQFGTAVSMGVGLVSIGVFLYLIDYSARFLRPVSIVQRVADSGGAVIRSIYPESTQLPQPTVSADRPVSPERTGVNTDAAGIVLALDLKGLVAAGTNHKGCNCENSD